MYFPNKKSGDPLSVQEFEDLEAYAYRGVIPGLGEARSPGHIHAVAHTDIPRFSIFSLGSAVDSVPYPKLMTASAVDGASQLLLTNGTFEVKSGDHFEARVIGSKIPVLLRTSTTDPPKAGWPCGTLDQFELCLNYPSGITCLSNVFPLDGIDVVWAIRQSQKVNFEAALNDDILAYNPTTKVLGMSTAKVKVGGSDSKDPETLASTFNVKVWNTHDCGAVMGDVVYLTPVLNVGFCMSHPAYTDS